MAFILLFVWYCVAVLAIVDLFRRKFGRLIILALLTAILLLPTAVYRARMMWRGIDHEFPIGDHLVEMTNDGPLAFTHDRGRASPYSGKRTWFFQTPLPDMAPPQDIGFSFSDYGPGTATQAARQCALSKVNPGLEEVIGDLPGQDVSGCDVSRSQRFLIFRRPDGSAGEIRCQNRLPAHCVIHIDWSGIGVSIPMWDVPLEDWQVALAHVEAILGQSYRVSE